MRCFLLLITGFCCCTYSQAQVVESYYDYNWEPCAINLASFYSKIEKTDSGYLRSDFYLATGKLQMQALFEDADCKVINGNCYYFYSNGSASAIGRRIKNKKEGVCVSLYSDGMMADSATYQDDIPIGSRLRWHRNGVMSDSIAPVNDSMNIELAWYDDGSPSEGGYYLHGKQHGTWKYFHKNGQVSAIKKFDHGALLTKEYFSENGTVLNDTSKVNHDAEFKGGDGEWKWYLEKNIYWPNNYKLENTNQVTVIVNFIINEEGKVEFAEMAIPFNDKFDSIALSMIRRSPTWKPAMINNRKVKQFFRQPLTFQQPD